MYILWYFLFPLLFLNFRFKGVSVGEQIGRYIFGIIYSFIAFYFGNADKSLSFVLANLKWVAVIQIIITALGMAEVHGNELRAKKGAAVSKFIWAYVLICLASIFYSNMPYIIGGAKNLYAMTAVKESSEQSPKINTENIIIIPPETAYYQMQTLIGTLPNPSLYKIGQLSLTRTDKGAYYVAPVDIEGNLKALLNKELPGVVYVSAERLEDAKLIEMPHKYGESLVFNNYIYRKLRDFKQNSILLNADIELGDDLTPYYIGSYGHYKYGRNGIVVDGIVVYNTKSGEIKDYPKDKAPAWVDQVYTAEVAEKYNNYYGKYQNGLINLIIAKKGVHIPTTWSTEAEVSGLEIESQQVVPVVGNNGDMYYFTDHTNTSENSTTMTGYALMNTRTGEMIYYKTPGFLNGQGAMDAVEKLLGAEKANWTTSQPILYNIYGVDTWIIPVINRKDGSFVKLGLVASQSKYAMLADNKSELLDSFKKAIADGSVNMNSDVKIDNDSKLEEVTVEGKLIRINQSVENGKSVFYLKLDTVPNKIFMVSKGINADVVLARDGDKVQLKYVDMEEQKIIPVVEFILTIE